MKKTISAQQLRAIRALLTNTTQKAAAKASDTPQRTLERWLTEPDFLNALHEAQNEVFQYTANGLNGLQNKAIEAFDDVLQRPAQPGASTKLKAASEILRLCTEYHQIAIDEARIRKLEEKAHL